jgi:hypothetical protein
LLGGEIGEELADGGDLVGNRVVLSVVVEGGDFAEEGVAARGCEREYGVGDGLVELRGGLGLLGLQSCHGLSFCCAWRWC